MERPEALAGRARLTDEEVAALQERGDRIFGDGRSSFAGATNAFRAALENVETYNNLAAPSSSVAMVPLEFDNRTSLVLEPPDGRIPPMTTEAQRRQAAVDTGWGSSGSLRTERGRWSASRL